MTGIRSEIQNSVSRLSGEESGVSQIRSIRDGPRQILYSAAIGGPCIQVPCVDGHPREGGAHVRTQRGREGWHVGVIHPHDRCSLVGDWVINHLSREEVNQRLYTKAVSLIYLKLSSPQSTNSWRVTRKWRRSQKWRSRVTV